MNDATASDATAACEGRQNQPQDHFGGVSPFPAGRMGLTIAMLAIAVVCGSASRSSGIQVQPQPIDLIPSGTVIGDTAPGAWSHLILKSLPRATEGDTDRVHPSNLEIASKFSTAIVARVDPVRNGRGEASFSLAALAGGVSTRVGANDTIVTPDTWRKVGADLSMVTSQVLKEVYRQQCLVNVVVRSETFAIVDTPVVVRVREKNRPMMLRYGIIVDERTGRLDTFAWLIHLDEKGRYGELESQLHWLPPNHVVQCPLHVDVSEYFLGVPSRKAYACVSVPRGRVQWDVPDDRRVLLVRSKFLPAEATRLDAWLREMARQVEQPPVRQAASS